MESSIDISEVYPGFESVIDADGECIGVVVPSRKFPYHKVFFCYVDCEFYYGMSSLDAVMAYLNE